MQLTVSLVIKLPLFGTGMDQQEQIHKTNGHEGEMMSISRKYTEEREQYPVFPARLGYHFVSEDAGCRSKKEAQAVHTYLDAEEHHVRHHGKCRDKNV